MNIKLLGIDLDGTLLQANQTISDQDREAVHAALDAGLIVAPCTGRAWHESAKPLQAIRGLDQGIFVTGALVTKLACGTVTDHSTFPPDLLQQIVDTLADLPEAVLIFRVPDRLDHDYLITGNGKVTPNTQWWFEYSNTRSVTRHPLNEEDRQLCTRVAVVSALPDMQHFVQDIRQRFGDRVVVHSFDGVERTDDNDAVQILEIFPAGCDKWRGLQAIAKQHGIADHEIAMIGDQVNDLPAITAAGLGIAMGNAIQPVKDAANQVTKPNADSGVAYAIQQILDGTW